MSTGNLPRLRECLIELHLPAFREHYAAQAALATQESLSYPRFLLSLSEIEVAERHERKSSASVGLQASLGETLTALDRSRLPQSVDRQLTALLEGTFLDRAENVLAFGNPGSGKTHLVCALGQELILLGRRGSVFYLRPAGTAIAAGQNRSDSGEGAQETGSLRGSHSR